MQTLSITTAKVSSCTVRASARITEALHYEYDRILVSQFEALLPVCMLQNLTNTIALKDASRVGYESTPDAALDTYRGISWEVGSILWGLRVAMRLKNLVDIALKVSSC